MKRVILIILLAVFFRCIFLNSVPNAIGGDELHYVMTAKSIALTGRDISGTWNPWSLLWFRYPPNEHQAELPYLLHLVSDAPFPFSMILVKLPFAILSVGIVILLWAITSALFGSSIGIATAAIAAVNPWLIVMGRSAYEATPAMFFYLLAFLVILRTKKWNILWTLIPLLLAFYSYIATKVIFAPYVAGICLFAYLKHGKTYIKQYLILCVIAVLTAVGFYYMTITDPSGSRLAELFFPHSPAVADAVNQLRKTTIASPFLSLLVNKYTIYFQTLLSKFFRIFSASYLFEEGDQFFLPIRQGFFYWLDAVFLFIGTIWMYTKNKKYTWALWLLIFIGTIPQLINTTIGDFSIHLTMLFPFLLPVIGAGIVHIVNSFPKRFTFWIISGCIALYTINVANFSLIYFFQYPLVGKNDFHMRVLARYIELAKGHQMQTIVYTTISGDVFQKFIVYTNAITKHTIPQLASPTGSSIISFEGVTFASCGTDNIQHATPVITVYDVGCDNIPAWPHASITTLVDAGEMYKIFNDAVCQTYQLKRYPEHISIKNFDIGRLPERKFCEIYISQR
jgi:4-amino-4-deoxy-L-arabinose transferase-like glycosyltransferase